MLMMVGVLREYKRRKMFFRKSQQQQQQFRRHRVVRFIKSQFFFWLLEAGWQWTVQKRIYGNRTAAAAKKRRRNFCYTRGRETDIELRIAELL